MFIVEKVFFCGHIPYGLLNRVSQVVNQEKENNTRVIINSQYV